MDLKRVTLSLAFDLFCLLLRKEMNTLVYLQNMNQFLNYK